DVLVIPRLKLFAMFAVLLYGIGTVVKQPQLALAGVVAAGLAVACVQPNRCRTCGERWAAKRRSDHSLHAPLPDARHTVGLTCPRCGMPELHYLRYRRLKAIPLALNATIAVIGPLCVLLPNKRCDNCARLVWL
ncbi:MAG TPA: hypothetical protein VF846_07350, partial [Thermoanaerobaculia bacterium]